MLFQLPLPFPFVVEIKQHTITSARLTLLLSNAIAPANATNNYSSTRICRTYNIINGVVIEEHITRELPQFPQLLLGSLSLSETADLRTMLIYVHTTFLHCTAELLVNFGIIH